MERSRFKIQERSAHRYKYLSVILSLVLCTLFFSACTIPGKENEKVRDLEMTVLSSERVPKELMEIIDEKKSQPFELTFQDEDYLYICIGYGEQSTGGYSIAVDELYLSDKSVCVKTTLLGPKESTNNNPLPSAPFIVIRTEKTDKPVTFV